MSALPGSPEAPHEGAVAAADPVPAEVGFLLPGGGRPGARSLPESCARCLAPPSRHLRERSLVPPRTVLVPYCDSCFGQAYGEFTTHLAVLLASLVAGLSLALGLPLLLPFAPLGVDAGIVLVGAAAPLAVVVRRRLRSPGYGRAIVLHGETLVGVSSEFGRNLERLGINVMVPPGPPRAAAGAMARELAPWAAVALGVLATLTWYHALHHPELRVLNLGGRSAVLWVDGVPFGAVAPSSRESPAAGARFRVPSGHHELRLTAGDGAPDVTASVFLRAGADHLFAPAVADSAPTCFAVDEHGYGRAGTGGRRRALTMVRGFAVLPVIDRWFAELPPAPREGALVGWTGGTQRALRQVPCGELAAGGAR